MMEGVTADAAAAGVQSPGDSHARDGGALQPWWKSKCDL